MLDPLKAAAAATKKESAADRRLRIAERVRTLPTDPGCYVMKDRQGEIFYIGKATDLRARVRSYFSGSDTRQFVEWLDDLLHELDVIVVRNEKEALLLERTLVRQHQPRFNIKLRDDKNFIHLRLVIRPSTLAGDTLRQRFPRVEVVRGPREGGSTAGVRIFGPYHSATSARSTLRVLNRHFQLRTCRDSVLENRTRPCLQHQIGRCPAPCVFEVPQYGEGLQDAALFLSGRRTELAERLRERMLDLAEKEAFESAAHVRDQLAQIVTALHDQAVTDVEHRRNEDVYGIERCGSLLVLTRVVVRDGRMQGVESFEFERAEFPTEELVTSWLGQLYDDIDVESIPDEVLLSQGLGGCEGALQEVVSERCGRRVEFKVPQRGRGGKLIEIALRNAASTMQDRLRKTETRERGLATLQERLGLVAPPRVIECFDVSLFQGQDAVASQVCFVDGAAAKSRYRRFNIKNVEGTDDFAMLYEAIGRRLRRGKELGDLPDLLIVDGGKGQLNTAITACRDHGIAIRNEASGTALTGTHPREPPRFSLALAAVAKARTFNVTKTKGGKARSRPQTPREDREGLAPVAGVAGVAGVADAYGVDNDLQMSPERLFVPGVKDPLVLRAHTADRFLVEQIRDEAHRFAISAHRGRRKRRTLRSVLDEIQGVGPAKRKALLRVFHSAQGVADADVAVVAAVPGIGLKLAQHIADALRVDPTPAETSEVVDDVFGDLEAIDDPDEPVVDADVDAD